jgi:hypothetical protein
VRDNIGTRLLRNVSSELRNVGFELRNVGSELRNVGFELRNVGFELRNVSIEGVCTCPSTPHAAARGTTVVRAPSRYQRALP